MDRLTPIQCPRQGSQAPGVVASPSLVAKPSLINPGSWESMRCLVAPPLQEWLVATIVAFCLAIDGYSSH